MAATWPAATWPIAIWPVAIWPIATRPPRPARVTAALSAALAALAAALAATLAIVGLLTAPAAATPALTMDVATGDVLYQSQATQPWYPASTTKLMTVLVALQAVRDGRIGLDTPLLYSAYARSQPPSKMGFQVGTQVTLINALRMLMVKSANDIAVTVAEGVSGSVPAFAEDMNATAAAIGLRESHFVNPNGLPAANHVSSARDMALIARALYTQFPDQLGLFDIGALQFGSEIIGNHNNLLGRYPGADGMKTGFTCPAGFNVVASAFRDGRRIVTIVFGAPSVAARTAKAAALFDRAFAGIDRPTGSIVALPGGGEGPAPDMRQAICHARGRLLQEYAADVEQLDAPLMPQPAGLGLSALSPEKSFLFATPRAFASAPTATYINSVPQQPFAPVPVHIGAEPGYSGPVAQARAPHSPIGSEPMPAAVEAYAATAPAQGVGSSPLGVDPAALPMRGRHARAAKHRGRAVALKAAAEAPDTKVIAGDEDEAAAKHGAEGGRKAAAKPTLKPAPKAAAKSAAKPSAKTATKPAAETRATSAAKPPARKEPVKKAAAQ